MEGRKTQTRRRQKKHPHTIEPGDTLWVKEPLCKGALWASNRGGSVARYEADRGLVQRPIRGSKATRSVDWRWQRHRLPSMFMPKEACRLRLRVTVVRTQPLSEISHEEALAEGVDGIGRLRRPCGTHHARHPGTR